MRKGILIIAICIFLFSIGAKADGLKFDELFEKEENGFQTMHTTAYMCGTITANGSAVHIGGCACNTHMGDIAVIYTLEGEYLGIFECNDKGVTDGLIKGTVVDIYFPTYAECKDWMRATGGKVKVKWISGNG